MTVSQETIIEIVARLFRDQEREERQETCKHVVDELIQEVTDTIIRETIEDTKITTCLEEGLPPEISQLIEEYDDTDVKITQNNGSFQDHPTFTKVLIYLNIMWSNGHMI